MENKPEDNIQDNNYDFLKDYEFDFENLAFGGGGVKMGAYAGVIQVLEETGIMQRCKGFAGTSGGAICAMMCAIGMTADQMIEYEYTMSFEKMIKDARFGFLSFLPNLFWNFGMYPSHNFLTELRKLLEKITGDPDITFDQVYQRYGKELCAVATNTTTKGIEYFHPKTTPDFSVALAVRASCALPVYMEPVRVKGNNQAEQCYCDGGILCNFPIHAFDGWYLSMKAEHCFFNKLGEEGEFEGFNRKTLGMMLFCSQQGELHENDMFSIAKHAPKMHRPDTPLVRARGEECDKEIKRSTDLYRLTRAAKRFFALLQEMIIDKHSSLNFEEFQKAFHHLDIHAADVELLFGKDCDFKKAFDDMDVNKDHKITYSGFVRLLCSKGLEFQAVLQGRETNEVKSFPEFFDAALNSMMNRTTQLYLKSDDKYRTFGVYTDYIKTADFGLKLEDKKFLVQQGRNACYVNLDHMVDKYKYGKLPEAMNGCVQPKK